MSQNEIRIGITHGDINGIGYEVIMKTLAESRVYENVTVILYGSPKVAAYHRKTINAQINVNFNQIRTADEANARRLNIINCCPNEVKVELGKSTPAGGEAALQSLQAAVKDLKDGKIDALVTAPIDKYNIHSDQFKFAGHTEYLAQEFDNAEVLMFLVSEIMRVGVVTGHIPLSKVAATLTESLIVKKLEIMNKSLIQDFGIRKPRIAVLGLNPHAGDNGVIGSEESTIITPAIEKARKSGIMAFGPFPSDGLFGSGDFKKYDAVLAMYHDQGLIPFKSFAFEHGVNFTAGLPAVRTSPDHGTAYDIAGKDQASEASFREAFFMAIDVLLKREEYLDLTSNKLKTHQLAEEK